MKIRELAERAAKKNLADVSALSDYFEVCRLLEDVYKRQMELRFGLSGRPEKTQKEVAEILGISQSYISRLEKRIIRKLRKDICRAE